MTTLSELRKVPRDELAVMADSGQEVLECYRVLAKGGTNIVAELLKGQGTFYEWNHYPEGDVFDSETHSQYYYHAHRSEVGEHGHFHTFLRQPGMPPGVAPVRHEGEPDWPKGAEALCHIVAISMDKRGFPTHLFTTNRWVTGECWYRADHVIAMLDRFLMDHAYPSWPVNRWISAMMRLYRPDIVRLLHARDRVVDARRDGGGGDGVFEDRGLEITSSCRISVDKQIERIERVLAENG